MPKLEKYIQDHIEEFDSHEPDPGHLIRFEQRLKEQHALEPVGYDRMLVLKIAALIIILVAVSVFVFDLATREIRDRFASGNQGTELPLEIREAVQYYDNQTSKQLAILNKLETNHEDAGAVSNSAFREIRSLDATTEELKKSLAENPGNERILDAIIQNQQMKETMLKTIIFQLSQSQK